MKYLTILFFFTLCTLSTVSFSQNFAISPDSPSSSEKINVMYDSSNGPLAKENVYCIAYAFMGDNNVEAFDVSLESQNTNYKGSFTVPKDARVVFFVFENEESSKVDNNNELGYYTPIYKNNKIHADVYTALASAYGSNGSRILRIKANPDLQAQYFNQSLSDDLSKKYDSENIIMYTDILNSSEDNKGKSELTAYIKSKLEEKSLSEKELTAFGRVSSRLKNKELSEFLNQLAIKKYPSGQAAAAEKISDFRASKTIAEKLSIYEASKKTYRDNDDFSWFLNSMARTLANDYARAKEYDKMEDAMVNLSVRTKADILNNLAWGYSGESIAGEGTNLEEALEMSKRSLSYLKTEMENPNEKPPSYSTRHWKKNMFYSYMNFADTYALLSYKLGNLEDAIKYQKIAIDGNGMRDSKMNERYAIYLEEGTGPNESLNFLQEVIRAGKGNSGIKERYARLFMENVTLESALDMHLATLEEEAKSRHIKEIKEKLISEKAPQFDLKNLLGEQVNLESLKGKIVVVDFWATWCGPCIASFPGMQVAVNKFSESNDVEFVFIDTWESAENKEEQAQQFLTENNYSFNVLMDNQDKVVKDFDVNGIPSKFIIDKTGMIRYKGTGFGGSENELVSEISILIDLIREENDSSKDIGVRP